LSKISCSHRLEPAGTGWNRLEPAGAGWNRLEPAGTGWSRLELDSHWCAFFISWSSEQRAFNLLYGIGHRQGGQVFLSAEGKWKV